MSKLPKHEHENTTQHEKHRIFLLPTTVMMMTTFLAQQFAFYIRAFCNLSVICYKYKINKKRTTPTWLRRNTCKKKHPPTDQSWYSWAAVLSLASPYSSPRERSTSPPAPTSSHSPTTVVSFPRLPVHPPSLLLLHGSGAAGGSPVSLVARWKWTVR